MVLRYLFLFLLLPTAFWSSAQSVSKKTDIANEFKKAKKEYTEFERQHGAYVATARTRIHYLTWGNPKDKPLIWSHGSLLNSYEIAPVAKALTDAGYYLIAADYYGHGQTPIPDKEISIYSCADDLMVLMDSLHIEKAVIGGFSRGGYIAAAFYQSYPDRVNALILEDGGSVAFNTMYHQLPQEDLDRKINSMLASPESDRLFNGSYKTEFEAYQSLYNPGEGGTQFEILALIHKTNTDWITYKGLSTFFGMANEDQIRRLILKPESMPLYAASITMVHPQIIFRNLKVPMLILDPVSDNDPMPYEKENIALAAKFPELISRVQFDGVAHNIHYAQPDRFANALIKFLSSKGF